jgi:CIC family chloride channel protein
MAVKKFSGSHLKIVNSGNYIANQKSSLVLKIYKLSLLSLHRVPLHWLRSKMSRNTFMIVSCILVGLTAGAAAVAMKTLVHYMYNLSHNDWGVSPILQKIIFFGFPFFGIVLTVFIVKTFLNDQDGKGLSNILYNVAKGGSDVPRKKMWSQLVTTPITVGLGGSSGLEAPIAITGAAIGSNFGIAYKLNYRDKTLLLASGVAAGIAGVFNAPIAGVMFSIEVILAGIAVIEFIPLILASVAGTLFSQIVLTENILFSFTGQEHFNYYNTPYYVILGLLCGACSLFFAIVSNTTEKFFNRFPKKGYYKAVTGGIILVGLCILFPSFFGEGYESIIHLANNEAANTLKNGIWDNWTTNELFIIIMIGVIGTLKSIATSVTIFSGGNGGNFAPSLFVGAHLGFFFASIMNYMAKYLPWLGKIPVSNFALVGMCGILSGVMYAPITAIFLIAEVAGGYGLIIPLMIVSSISYFFVRQFNPYSLTAVKLGEKGVLLTEDADKNILSVLTLDTLVDKKAYCLYENDGKKEIMLALKRSHRNIFPVISSDRKLKGVIIMDQLKEVMMDPTKDYNVNDFMRAPDALIQVDENLVDAMKKFDDTKAWSLPVLNGDVFVGMISKSQLLNSYRKELLKQSM